MGATDLERLYWELQTTLVWVSGAAEGIVLRHRSAGAVSTDVCLSPCLRQPGVAHPIVVAAFSVPATVERLVQWLDAQALVGAFARSQMRTAPLVRVA
mmetsp:Transcript_34215/g.54622  ORF Transcript_34215/g.54622 Transcript_34215/m.54622 type:complete len:98 (-) Transcript_34215:346-639(-)